MNLTSCYPQPADSTLRELDSSMWRLGRISPMPKRIPSNWKLIRLTDVAKLETGHTPSRDHAEYWNGGVPWISLQDSGALDVPEIHSTSQIISRLGLENSSARLLPKGTVVFSRTATVGKSTVMAREMATSQDFANFICGDRIHNHYLKFLFRYMAPEWRRLMAGSTHNTVYLPIFRDLQVLLPTVGEQEAIAEALTDTDAFIESLEQLIAKKRQIKRGVMQELLTGKRRLPGFEKQTGTKRSATGLIPQDWIEFTVGASIDFEGGSQPDRSVFRSTRVAGYIRLIQIRDYKTDKYETYIPQELARRFCNESDIMIGRYGPPIFQILRGLAGAYNVALIKAKPKRHIDKTYAYFFLKQESLFRFVDKLSQRSSGQTGIDLKELRAYPLPLPPTQAEQQAIAAVLSDMDRELDDLVGQLSKLKQIKQGMMQELLTGKIRLV